MNSSNPQRESGSSGRMLRGRTGLAWLGVILLPVGLLAWSWWAGGGDNSHGRASFAGPGTAAGVAEAPDLPPADTQSVLDQHLARLGEIPYPLPALLNSFRPLDRWSEGSVRLLIPDGRSLAKGEASYRQPRVLAAVQVDPWLEHDRLSPVLSGRLFFGLVEPTDTVEILAYNPAAGRFEFQLIENYCDGCQPELRYARRALCTACHQGGLPIFAERPWSETNAHRAVAQRIAAARGVAWSDASQQRYLGAPLSTQIVMPETFDERVGQGARVVLAQRIWQQACGNDEDLSCRRALLAQALSRLVDPGAFDPADAANRRVLAEQSRHWPADGIVVGEHQLSDRIPPQPDWLDRLARVFMNWWPTPPGSGPAGSDSAERVAAFRRLPALPPRLDPLTVRAPRAVLHGDTLTGVKVISDLFIPQDRQRLRQWLAGQDRTLQDILAAGELDEKLGQAVLNRLAVMRALSRILTGDAPALCCPVDDAQPAAAMPQTHLNDIPPGSPLEVFRRYCFTCHRGNPVTRLNFMAGETPGQVLAAIRATPAIVDALDYGRGAGAERRVPLMPPAGSTQRARLNAARAASSDDLARMQRAVSPTAPD